MHSPVRPFTRPRLDAFPLPLLDQGGPSGKVEDTGTLIAEFQESMVEALVATGRFRVLRKLEPRTNYFAAGGDPVFTALYVDVETTGLDYMRDGIIQLAVLPFTFTSDGRICSVAPCESWYEDPGVPVSAEITALTGIRQEDVSGQQIDEARVLELLQTSALVLAHHAAFDRPFLERRLPAFAAQPWGCSMADVPWSLTSTRLEFLAERQAGVFYEAHRADVDCRAGVHVLTTALSSGETAMSAMLAAVRAKTARVWALGSAFKTRTVLKARGYRWSGGEDGQPRSWYRDLRESELEAEREWLASHIYGKATHAARVQRFGTRTRYSRRLTSVALEVFG